VPLAPGTRLGPYEVTAYIGAGGMGVVYRARDAKLGRDVALKILPEAFVGDPDRVARFEREAQVVAALNHPNIAIIHGFQESDGVRALVLELVEGETLTDVIARGPLAVNEALAIARQIADALEAAHDKGIVHRDLKPDNVKVTPSGTIKVLDFGLAKMLEPDPARTPSYAGTMSPTISLHATYGGLILGTPAYMSPEQARGKLVDRRADIWAFGCVLFEMLTSRKTFDPGETISDAVAQILTSEPEWSALPADTPAHAQTLLRRCLQKDPQKRLPHIGLVRLELDEGAQPGVASAPVRLKPDTTSPATVARKRALLVAGALAAVALGAAFTWLMMRTPSAVPRQTRFSVAAVRPISGNAFFRNIAISPDGTQFVYASALGAQENQLFVRRFDRLEAQVMRGITSAGSPFFSPDSRSIGFFAPATQELKKVSIEGGPAIPLCRFQGTPRGAAWATDDTIVFATNDPVTGLFNVSAGGGDPRVLTKPDPQKGEQDHLFPSMLPGNRAVLFTIAPVGGLVDNSQVAVLDLTTGETKTLIRGGSNAMYVDTGHLVYASLGSLRAVRFDLDRLTVLSDPVAVVDQVRTLNSGAAQFDVSRSGTLVFMPGDGGGVASVPRSLVWVDRSGREQPIAAPGRSYAFPRLSPDGKRVALDIRDQANDIWIWDLERETLTKLTTNPGVDAWPVWTPNGARIVFVSSRDGIAPNLFWQRADFTGTAERLSTSTNSQNPTSISPDGKNLLVQEVIPGNNNDLNLIGMDALLTGKPADGKLETRPLLHTPAAESAGEISPDGRWLAYYSNSSGTNEVYVRAFPNVDGGGLFPISTAGGTRPAWSRNGRELFYLDLNGAMWVVPVRTTPAFSAGKPTKLFDASWWSAQSGRTYDVTADGQRFLAIKDPSSDGADAATQTFSVVLNWQEELKRLVPTR
jgi:hypothetical protein